MKLSLLFAAATLAAVSFSRLAHADDAPTVGARFESSATHQTVQTAACSFDAASTFDGREHVFDVHVAGERCPNHALAADSIPLFVRFEYGDKERVVVAAVVPENVDANKLRAAVIEIAKELQRRVERLSASPPSPSPPPPPPPQVVYRPIAQSSVVPSRDFAWARESYGERNWYTPYKRASPGLMAGGILLIVAGSLATFGGTVSAFSNMNYGDEAPAAVALGMGFTALIAGIPMLVAGAKKVPNMTVAF